MCVVALMGISVKSILWLLCVLAMVSSSALIWLMSRAVEEMKICKWETGVVIAFGIWMTALLLLFMMIPPKSPSVNPDCIAPYVDMIAILSFFAAGGIGLAGVMLLGFILNIFRKRKGPAV
jgi:hypothetical protein